MADEYVPLLVEAMTAWNKATTAWREACERGETNQEVQAYETAKEAWLVAQEAAPLELAADAFWEARRVFHERLSEAPDREADQGIEPGRGIGR